MFDQPGFSSALVVMAVVMVFSAVGIVKVTRSNRKLDHDIKAAKARGENSAFPG